MPMAMAMATHTDVLASKNRKLIVGPLAVLQDEDEAPGRRRR